MKEMKEFGFLAFLYMHRVGSPKTWSISSLYWPFDSDPDGSGSIQRSWSVNLIRIHQIRGFGP